MNRYALNSQVIGVGAGKPLSVASAFQALYLVASAARSTVRTRAVVDDNLNLSAVASPTIYRIFEAAQTMSLAYEADVHRWVKVYGRAVQNFALGYRSAAGKLVLFRTRTILYLRDVMRAKQTRFMDLALSVKAVGRTVVRSAILAPVEQALRLGRVVEFRKAFLEVFHQDMGLLTYIDAQDVPTAMAASDRTAIVSWFTRQVIVPAAEFSGSRKATLDVQTGTAPTGGSGGATSGEFNFTGKLDDLRDVESKNATPGEVLTYENGEWKPTKIDGGEF